MPDARARRRAVQQEFERAAELFAQRTEGRFDALRAVEFARVERGHSVLEVAAGTGNFLSLFAEVADLLVAVDLTLGMLQQAAARFPRMQLLAADAEQIPIRSRSFDLVACAQAFHHLREPIPVLKEMRRVVKRGGHVLVVDQVGPEKYEEVVVLNELEILRDPSHAVTRPPSAFRIMMWAAGLEVIDEKIHSSEQRLSAWMWPGEFPPERIEAVRDFIERRGHETGKDFRRDGEDWVFTRRRIMLLARPI